MVQCPACKDYDIHRSKWSGALERMFILFLHRPVRCYSCYSRFHTWMFLSVKPRGTRYVAAAKKASPPAPMAVPGQRSDVPSSQPGTVAAKHAS